MAFKFEDAGDGEPQIVARLHLLFTEIEQDAITAIKTKYWAIGREIMAAEEHGYVKPMGLKGWMYANFKKGETTARECKQCWKDRHIFDRALEWWRTGNTGFTPSKITGPRFSNELCKAYSERLMSDADKANRKGRRKKMDAKALREEAAKWRTRYDRAKCVIIKWADEDGRETHELNGIEIEIAAEAEAESEEGDLPLHSTRPIEGTDVEAETEVADTKIGETEEIEQVEEPSVAPTPEQHPGVVPDTERYDFVDLMRSMAQSRREIARYVPPDPKKSEPVVLDRVLLLPEQREAIERKYGLKLWSGVTKDDDELLRHRRAAFYSLNTPAAADKPLIAKAFWRSVTTDQDVLANLAKERERQAAATARKAAKSNPTSTEGST